MNVKLLVKQRVNGALGMTLLLLSSACAGPAVVTESVADASSAQAQASRRSPIASLLEQADAAYSRGRYTRPADNNAYDIYQAVLMLEPGNPRAQAGLDAVLLAYVDHVRRVMAAGQLDTAQELLSRGGDYFPEALMLTQLSDEISQARAAIAARRTQAAHADVLAGEKILLPELELDAASEEVVEQLTAIAERVRESRESVMIYARSDREGRWIYQTLQQAAADYRVRGDIRISRVPAVVIMEPL